MLFVMVIELPRPTNKAFRNRRAVVLAGDDDQKKKARLSLLQQLFSSG